VGRVEPVDERDSLSSPMSSNDSVSESQCEESGSEPVSEPVPYSKFEVVELESRDAKSD
jgi:hypothetical protein